MAVCTKSVPEKSGAKRNSLLAEYETMMIYGLSATYASRWNDVAIDFGAKCLHKLNLERNSSEDAKCEDTAARVASIMLACSSRNNTIAARIALLHEAG